MKPPEGVRHYKGYERVAVELVVLIVIGDDPLEPLKPLVKHREIEVGLSDSCAMEYLFEECPSIRTGRHSAADRCEEDVEKASDTRSGRSGTA